MCSSCTEGPCLHQEPQGARPCHHQGQDVVCSWMKNVPFSIIGFSAARRVTSVSLVPGMDQPWPESLSGRRGCFCLSLQREIQGRGGQRGGLPAPS